GVPVAEIAVRFQIVTPSLAPKSSDDFPAGNFHRTKLLALFGQLFDLAHGLSATLRHGHVRPVTPPGHSAFLSGTHDSMALFMSNDTKRSSWSFLITVSSASAPPSSNWRDKSVFCAINSSICSSTVLRHTTL